MVKVLYILFIIMAIVWTIWFIGFPIYKKIKGERVLDSFAYSLGLSIGALLINVLNLTIKLVR